MADSEQPLMADPPECPPEEPSKCSKCVRCLVLPLDVLIWPITTCLTSRCWNFHRFFQYDLTLQLMGLHQIMIGAIWSTTLDAVCDILDTQHHRILALSMYCITTYTLCHIIIWLLNRHDHFGSYICFFVGALGHIVAFGVKELGFQVMEYYFSDSFKMAFCYFWFCLAVSILMVYGLSALRKRFCYALKRMKTPITNWGHDLKTKSVLIFDRTKSHLKSMTSLGSQSSVSVNLYEDDYVHQLMNEGVEGQLERRCTQRRHREEREHFHDLIHEIDADVFTVAMGGVFVEVICIAIFSSTVLMGDSNVNYTESDEGSTVDILLLIITSLALSVLIVFIFWVFTKFVTFIQMSRDRALYAMFKGLHHKSANTPAHSHELKIGHHVLADKNCCIAGCIKFSYKSYKLSEHIITFTTAFMGWGFGWSMISCMYSTEDTTIAWQCSLILTGLGVVLYFTRSRRLKNQFEAWRDKVLYARLKVEYGKLLDQLNRHRHRAAIREESCTEDDMANLTDDPDDEENEQQQDLMTLTSTLESENGVHDSHNTHSHREDRGDTISKVDILDVKAKEHRDLYRISSWNFFFRKGFVFMLGLPWEVYFELKIEEYVEDMDEVEAILIRFAVAIAGTLVLSYSGMRFAKILKDVHGDSISHAISQLLRGNYMKLKKFKEIPSDKSAALLE